MTKSVEIQHTAQLRKFITNVMIGVRDDDITVDKALVIIAGAKVINESLYSEIKTASMLLELGKAVPEIGELEIFGDGTDSAGIAKAIEHKQKK